MKTKCNEEIGEVVNEIKEEIVAGRKYGDDRDENFDNFIKNVFDKWIIC